MYSLYSWGTPFEAEELYSFDPLSISVQVGLPKPYKCLPVLIFKNDVAETGFWRIVRFLQGEGHGLGVALNKEQLSQTTAYVSMIQDGLVDAIIFMWYLVPENFVQVIRPRLAGMFGLPLSLVMPTHLKDCATKRLIANGMIDDGTFGSSSSSSNEDSEPAKNGFLQNKFLQLRHLAKEGFKRQASTYESVEAAIARHPVLNQADQYLSCLSRKLGEREYFFGKAPSLLDAVAYGHLSLVLRVDLPHNPLRMLITTRYINLAEHCARVHAQLQPPTIASRQNLVAGLGSYVKQTVSEYTTIPDFSVSNMKDSPETAGNLRAVVGALCIFIGYVIYNDVLSTPSSTLKDVAKEPDNSLLGSLNVGDILGSVNFTNANNHS
ncbi:hypothetical protein LPJ74_001387 [Coemansia sp. RSA 1843]|nr:hypothetical protein LPJ74_001387 [Coemansia sp. RSA 1843]